MSLTPKQEAFVHAYIETGNASEAYRRAYNAADMSQDAVKVEASRLLDHPYVALTIDSLQAEHRKRHEITVDRILAELGKIGFADIRKVIKWGHREIGEIGDSKPGEVKFTNDVVLLPSAEVDDATAAAIAEVAETRDGVKLKMHDKRAALVDMGKHLGMFKELHEHSGPDGGPVEIARIQRTIIDPKNAGDKNSKGVTAPAGEA